MKKQSAALMAALIVALLLVACGDLTMRRSEPVTTATATLPSEVSVPTGVPSPAPTTIIETTPEITETETETHTVIPSETVPVTPEPTREATEPPAPTEPPATTADTTVTTSTTVTETVTATEPDTTAPSPTPLPTSDEPLPETTSTTAEATTVEEPGATTAPTATPTAMPTPAPSPDPTPTPIPAPLIHDPGVYQVGIDLPAGDYVLTQPTQFRIAFESSFEPHVLIADKVTDGRTYVSLEDDDWFHFDSGQLYPPDAAPEAGELPLSPGMYKAGQDLQAGEYVLLAQDSNLDLTVDARHLEPSLSATVIFNRAYVSIEDGQFIGFDMGQLHSAADAPPVPAEGDLPQGIYKIGTDLQAGVYTLRSTNPMYRSSYAVFSAPRQVDPQPPVASGFFTNEEITVTVDEGQYLDVLQAEILRP